MNTQITIPYVIPLYIDSDIIPSSIYDTVRLPFSIEQWESKPLTEKATVFQDAVLKATDNAAIAKYNGDLMRDSK